MARYAEDPPQFSGRQGLGCSGSGSHLEMGAGDTLGKLAEEWFHHFAEL